MPDQRGTAGEEAARPARREASRSFTNRILFGLALGLLVGLFLGERVLPLKWLADGYVKLLQMTVLPYITVSIIASLGSLDLAQARRLGLRAGAVIAGLWGVTIAFVFLVPLVFPVVETASFFSAAMVEQRPPFNLLDLYIPSNPFHSLANNVVPAVVLFSLMLGVALIGVERKQGLLEVLGAAGAALARATRLVARLTPVGLFAIAAVAAGTLNLEQLGRLQVFLLSYVLVALLLSLWVLPGLVAALTPIGAGEMLALTRNALLTACVAGDLFIVLPVLIEASQELLRRHGLAPAEAESLPGVIVPASFNFPHSGKLLALSFVLFAGWFADAALSLGQYPRLAASGIVSFFGSVAAAMPFLLDLFHIPADTFQLFLATGVINSRFGSLLAAVHTLTVALLGAAAMSGALRFQPRRLLRFLAVTALLGGLTLGGARLLFARVLVQSYSKDQVLTGMRLRAPLARAQVWREPPSFPPEPADLPQLERIRRRGVLRVGYLADALPYAYFNREGELVGFDIDLAHRLAAELGLGLDLVPVERAVFERSLDGETCDLVMSGIAVTTRRASRIRFSSSYLDETLAFVVRDHLRGEFRSWDSIRLRGGTLGVPDVPYYVEMLERRLPGARLVRLGGSEPLTDGHSAAMDAMAMPAERGSAWTLLHPEYTVVIPEPDTIRIPLAYPVARHDDELASLLDTWIDLKRKDGTLDALYRYWILGQDAAPRRPRWSIGRDVLGWLD